MRKLAALVLIAATLGCVPAGVAGRLHDTFGQKATARVGVVETRNYYDGQRLIEERNGDDIAFRYHVNGSQFIAEHIATASHMK